MATIGSREPGVSVIGQEKEMDLSRPGWAVLDRPQEFRQLFNQYHCPVIKFFANRGFALEDCREMTQETFLAAYKSLDSFRGDCNSKTWLFSIAKNVWRRTLRDRNRDKRRADVVSLDDLLEDEHPDSVERHLEGDPHSENPLNRMLAEERVRLVRAALEDLPELMQLCVLLRLDQELSYQEIAVAMQVTLDTVKSQLHQARTKLKARLAEHFTEIEL